QAQLNLAKLATSQSSRLNSLLAQPVKTSSLPKWGNASKIGLPQYEKFGSGPELIDSYETDFSADRQRVEDALMARMNPQIEQERAWLEQRLVNQGLQPGSVAYDRAIDEASRAAADARYGAILNAGQEQSRLAGLARDAASFTNTSRQQGFDNDFR